MQHTLTWKLEVLVLEGLAVVRVDALLVPDDLHHAVVAALVERRPFLAQLGDVALVARHPPRLVRLRLRYHQLRLEVLSRGGGGMWHL